MEGRGGKFRACFGVFEVFLLLFSLHLFSQDKKLTRNEILDSQDLFVGSQVTDFGDYLIRHDEF